MSGNSIAIEQEVLQKALYNVVSVAIRKSTIIYLSHVRMRVMNEEMRFTATDNEISITDFVLISSAFTADISIDVFKLVEIVKRLPTKASITLQLDNNVLSLSSGRVEFALPYLDGASFPMISDEEQQASLVISKEEVKYLFGRVKFAMSSESTRQYLNGVYFESDGEHLITAATDIHRLAVSKLKKKSDFKFSCIVPRKTVSEMIRLMVAEENIVYLHGRDYINRIRLSVNSVTLNSKLIAATFPDFKAVIPKSFKYCVEVERALLTSAVERVGVVSPESSRAIQITFDGSQLRVDASNSDASFGTEVIEMKSEVADCHRIHFNHGYLLDVFSTMEKDVIRIQFNDASSQVMLCDGDNMNVYYIVMPMSV